VRVVVVGDDQVQSDAAGMLGFLHRADAAVHGDHKAHAFIKQSIQGIDVQAVAFVEAVGDVAAHHGS
jgi:hypothetical protein